MVLSVVFWNLDDAFDSAITLHLTEAEPQAEALGRYDPERLSIAQFFRAQGISIQTIMEMFPGSVVPDTERYERIFELAPQQGEYVFPRATHPGPITWDYPLKWQGLPMNEHSMEQLANLLQMSISVFGHWEDVGREPWFMFRVEPEQA